MKVTVHILFLLFYVASTYVVRQERVAETVWHVLNLPWNDGTKVEAPDHDPIYGLPKHREAKKVNKDFEHRPAIVVDLAPVSTVREFTALATSVKTQLTWDKTKSRAPPSFS